MIMLHVEGIATEQLLMLKGERHACDGQYHSHSDSVTVSDSDSVFHKLLYTISINVINVRLAGWLVKHE